MGYLILGIVLAVAVLYAAFSFRAMDRVSPSVSSEANTGEISLSTNTDIDTIDWVPYTDGQDNFAIERPSGWEVTDIALPDKPEYRRISFSSGMAGLSVFPRGEFDVGLPMQTSVRTPMTISGQPATMQEWDLPDGSWLAIVTLDEKPKGEFRMELSILRPDLVARATLKEMVKRFVFLP